MMSNFLQAGRADDVVLQVASDLVNTYKRLRDADPVEKLAAFAVGGMDRLQAVITGQDGALTGEQAVAVLEALDVCDACMQNVRSKAKGDPELRSFFREVEQMYGEERKAVIFGAAGYVLCEMDTAQRRDVLAGAALSQEMRMAIHGLLAAEVLDDEHENALDRDFGVLERVV